MTQRKLPPPESRGVRTTTAGPPPRDMEAKRRRMAALTLEALQSAWRTPGRKKPDRRRPPRG